MMRRCRSRMGQSSWDQSVHSPTHLTHSNGFAYMYPDDAHTTRVSNKERDSFLLYFYNYRNIPPKEWLPLRKSNSLLFAPSPDAGCLFLVFCQIKLLRLEVSFSPV